MSPLVSAYISPIYCLVKFDEWQPCRLAGDSGVGALDVSEIPDGPHPYRVRLYASFDASRPCNVHEHVLKNTRIMLDPT